MKVPFQSGSTTFSSWCCYMMMTKSSKLFFAMKFPLPHGELWGDRHYLSFFKFSNFFFCLPFFHKFQLSFLLLRASKLRNFRLTKIIYYEPTNHLISVIDITTRIKSQCQISDTQNVFLKLFSNILLLNNVRFRAQFLK